MSHSKKKKRAKPENLYDALQVKDMALMSSPTGDAGAAIVVQFHHRTEIDGEGFAFPLTGMQARDLMLKLAVHCERNGLLPKEQTRLIQTPHEIRH